MTIKILTGVILLCSTISCRKSQTTTSFDNSKIVKTYINNRGQVFSQTITDFDVTENWGWEDNFGNSWGYRVSRSTSGNFHVGFSIKDRIKKKDYTTSSLTISTSNDFNLSYSGDTKSTGGTLKITDLKTNNNLLGGEIWLMSGNWSGRMYDDNCGCEVDGSVTFYNVPFSKDN